MTATAATEVAAAMGPGRAAEVEADPLLGRARRASNPSSEPARRDKGCRKALQLAAAEQSTTRPYQHARALLTIHLLTGALHPPHTHMHMSHASPLPYTVTVSGTHHSSQQPARCGQVLLEVADGLQVEGHEAFTHQVGLTLLHAFHRRAAREALRAGRWRG